MTKTWRQARSIFYWTKWKTVVDILCCIYLRKLSWFHQHRLSFIILITSLAIRWYKVYHIKWDIAKLHTCPQRCCRLNTSSCKLTLFSAMLQVCNIFWSQRTSQVWIIPTDNFLVNFLKLSHENGQLWNFDPYITLVLFVSLVVAVLDCKLWFRLYRTLGFWLAALR